MPNTIVNSFHPAARRALLTLACAAALAAAPMLAQEPATQAPPPQGQHGGWEGRGGGERQLEHLTKALKLTPDQVTQIKAIEDDGRQQMMALRQDTTTPQADKRAKMMSLHQAQETKVKAVLTDDQKTKYEAMEAKMRERREEHRDGEQAVPTPPPAV
jgi:Spy/CpxP family protein refolding chaperone